MIVSQGASAIARTNLLILGGTTEASALCGVVHDAGLTATVSYAGRVARPARQAIPHRVGGFGGVEGLVSYISAQGITHLVDATHPFAARMSHNAVAAAQAGGIPVCALSRAAWTAQPGDQWQIVQDIPAAVSALAGPPRRVMLALGRMHLSDFTAQPQHFYLLRLVDPPLLPLGLPNCHVEVARGPFEMADDAALMQTHDIDLVVSKNAGGTGAYAKIAAARALGLPVMMIDRPILPERKVFTQASDVVRWVQETTLRGV